MKNFKKFIAMLLVLCMALPFTLVLGFAEKPLVETAALDELPSIFGDGENCLVIFVTGIGQTTTYFFDKSFTEEGAFPSGTLQDYENYAPLVAEGKYSGKWNLLASNFDEAFKDKKTINALVRAIFALFMSICLKKNQVRTQDVETVVKSMFRYNILDEDGNCDPRAVTPVYALPVSEYPGVTNADGAFISEARNRFYGAVPAADLLREKLGDDFEKYLYCFNFSPFFKTSRKVEEFHDYIEKILAENKVGAKKVVLIPLSMGAAVVNAYLAKYPSVSDNHVKRVVSVVGCWDGSDVFSDIVNHHYADNVYELIYNGIVSDLVGQPWGYLVNAILRIFPQKVLMGFINQVLDVVVGDVLFASSSFVSLIPSQYYDEARARIKSDKVRAEADFYYNAEKTLNERKTALEEQGVTFSYVCGYGLPFGSVTPDYKVFSVAKQSAATNSDEMINIDSTAPGTSYVRAGAAFEDSAGRILSPDGSIDISTTYRKDSTWFFYKQKHELQHNNTALRLAIDLALGRIKTIADCDNLEEDGYYYPQFNEQRDLKNLLNHYIPDLNRYCASSGYTLTAPQQALYDDVLAMTKSTVNHSEADKAFIDAFYNMLINIGVYDAPKPEGRFNRAINSMLKGYNDLLFKIYGGRGYCDICA